MRENILGSETTTVYHAYLMRIWREGDENWRFSLQSTRTGQRYGFADLQTVVQFIQKNLKQGETNEYDICSPKMA